MQYRAICINSSVGLTRTRKLNALFKRIQIQALMNVGYKHTPYNYKSSTASGLILLKGPLFPQKHRPAKFSGYVLDIPNIS